MKRTARLLIIMLLVCLMMPINSFAAPQGYREVVLTKKNFKQYFDLIKVKRLNAFGGYDGYYICLRSKLLKNGYYFYDAKGVAIQGTYKYRYKRTYKLGKKTVTDKTTITLKLPESLPQYSFTGTSSDHNYSYAKAWDIKIKNVKGTVIFVEPSNIIGVEREYDESNPNQLNSVKIKVRYPYDDSTNKETHWDDATHTNVVDYYYFYDRMRCGKQITG